MNSRISQLFICMTTIAFAIVVLIFTRQDILSAEHASKLAPPQHLRSYLDSFSSTLNNVTAVTGAAFDKFITSSTNSLASAMSSNDNVVFSNATALMDAPLVASVANRLFPHHSPDNLFSPVSILYTLSFLRLGVDGTLPASLLSMERMSQFFAHFSVATNADAHMVQLFCINADYPVKDDFQRNYGHFLPLLAGNFSHKPSVNEKIRRHFMPATQNDVNPIAKGIRSDTVAILYDTFYFRAIWAEPFLETQTKYVDFMPSNQKKRNIRALHRVFRRLPYLETEQFQLIEIPFDPRRYVFGVFLPKATTAAAAFNVKYDTDFAALQERWIPQLTMTSAVSVTVPKLRQRQWLRLGATMKKLASAVPEYRTAWEAQGLQQIVEGITDGLNEVIHEVPFTLWEAGANIAENTATQTATVSVSTAQGSLDEASATVRFVADRQFVYYIRDRVTNVLLLVGDFDA